MLKMAGISKNFRVFVCGALFVCFGVVFTTSVMAAPSTPPTNECFNFNDYFDGRVNGGKPDCSSTPASIDFSYGTIYSEGICSEDSSGLSQGTVDEPSSTAGEYCWCRITGFDDGNGYSETNYSTYAVYYNDYRSTGECQTNCNCDCARAISEDDSGIRSVLYETEFCPVEPETCTTILGLDSDFCKEEVVNSSYSAPDWEIDLSNNKILTGTSLCSVTSTTVGAVGTPDETTSGGSNCWCRATEYYDGSTTYTASSSAWMFTGEDFGGNNPVDCSSNCAETCLAFLIKGGYLCSMGEVEFCIEGAATYTVDYDCTTNGGAGTPTDSNSPYASGTTVTTLDSRACKPPLKKVFTGWNCGGTPVVAQGTFVISANTTCVAQYGNSRTLSFAAGDSNNDGTGTSATGSMSNISTGSGAIVTLPANAFIAPSGGYGFSGWSCNQGVGNVVAGGTFTMPDANVTCTAQWFAAPFSLTTTSLADGSTFYFRMSAAGTFVVDCGEKGTLSLDPGNGSSCSSVLSGNTITKNNTSNCLYVCTYSGTGSRTVSFGGAATGYDANTVVVSTISFNFYHQTPDANAQKIASISGSLGQIFGTVANPSIGSGQPKFTGTFRAASNMTGTNIPDPNNSGMNYALPPTLFNGISGTPAGGMFSYTFADCDHLSGSIPSGLFGNLSGAPAQGMFNSTFSGCTGLTGAIPSGLFGNLSGSPAQYMFDETFYHCSSLTGSIPSGLFGNLTGSPASYMFEATFSGCSGLTGTIPSGLFGNLTGSPAEIMFYATFDGCSGLTGAIPSGLFGNLSGAPARNMFNSTFRGCSNLTGFGTTSYVPGDFLANVDTNTSVFYQATNMFSGTQLDNPCPIGTYASTRTQFNDAGKPWCTACPAGTTTTTSGATSINDCVQGYSVTYSCGTGSGTPTDSNSPYTSGSTVTTLAANSCTVPNEYTFSGWSCNGTSVAAGGTFTISANTTCTAQYTPNIYAITLRNYNDSATHNTIYEKYNTGWYSDSATTTSINTAPLPTRSGYTFRGYYTATQSDLSATGGSGTRVIDASGTLPANTTYTAATSLYAAWAQDCNAGTGCDCTLTVNNDGTVTYTTSAQSGYTLTSGSGTYAPVCTVDPFSLTTVNLDSGSTFQFAITAAGTFTVDCGAGGSLSGYGVSGNTITKSQAAQNNYTCTYSSAGSKTIQFSGAATGYSTNATEAAITFYVGANQAAAANARKIASISGSLGQIFGTVANPTTGSGQPRFYKTFLYASNMTGTNIPDPNNSGMNYALPPMLFNGISGTPATWMFEHTFSDCTGLTGTIPATLFSGISGSPADSMFSNTFNKCSGLTGTIPATLFSGISGSPAASMFSSTFSGCTGLTGAIPSGLFGSLSGTPANWMFDSTFNGCSGLTGSIPSGLFGNLTGSPAEGMFSGTFHGCSGLTGSIPSGLFGSLSGSPAASMFSSTFSGCSGLTGAIPSGLFGSLSGSPAASMFSSTFSGCSGLTGAIPSGLFGSLSGSPAISMFGSTFSGCNHLSGSIPSGLFGNLSGSPAASMFSRTFENCSGLTGAIPSGLFGSISGAPADSMFSFTFYRCSGLTGSIPSGLFGNLSGAPAVGMFWDTFYGCSNLTGFGTTTYVPGTFLENINTDTSVLYQTTGMFSGTQLASTCPANTYTSTRTQFNDAGKPWCTVVEVYTITLRDYNNQNTHNTIYEKYNTGWYSDSATTTSINTAPLPTRSGYTFRGYYTATQSDLTATGGSGTRAIDASGTLPANTTYSADTNLYAAWAQDCNPGVGCTCNLVVNNDGTVTYQTGADAGYTLTSGSGTRAPVCSGSSIALTWDGGGTPASCTYGSTFNVPTPTPRTGYVFTGWEATPPSCSFASSVCGLTGSQVSSLEASGVGFNPHNGSEPYNANTYGLTSTGTWAVEFTNGSVVRGIASCNTSKPSEWDTIVNALNNGTMTEEQSYSALLGSCDSDAFKPSDTFDTSSSGQYCWCKVDSYTPSGESACNTSSSSWVFGGELDSSGCAQNCAYGCSMGVAGLSVIRVAMFGVSQ